MERRRRRSRRRGRRHGGLSHGSRPRGFSGSRQSRAAWPLRVAWLLLLLPVAGFAAYLSLPASWLARPDVDAFVETVATGRLPALSAEAETVALETVGSEPAEPQAPSLPPWRAWRATPVEAAGRPLVALVLTGLGRSQRDTATAIALPTPLSLAFSPYARPFGPALDEARAAGHEVLLDLPMEGETSDLESPAALLTLLDLPQNLQRLDAVLGAGEPLVGVAILGGERFLAAEDLAQPVLALLAGRGLLVVAPPIDAELARDGATTLLVADRRMDGAEPDVERLLAELERIALTEGSAIGVLPAAPEVLDKLRLWAASLGARGFVLAPATQVLERRLSGS